MMFTIFSCAYWPFVYLLWRNFKYSAHFLMTSLFLLFIAFTWLIVWLVWSSWLRLYFSPYHFKDATLLPSGNSCCCWEIYCCCTYSFIGNLFFSWSFSGCLLIFNVLYFITPSRHRLFLFTLMGHSCNLRTYVFLQFCKILIYYLF